MLRAAVDVDTAADRAALDLRVHGLIPLSMPSVLPLLAWAG
jgi:hypothetical protein